MSFPYKGDGHPLRHPSELEVRRHVDPARAGGHPEGGFSYILDGYLHFQNEKESTHSKNVYILESFSKTVHDFVVRR